MCTSEAECWEARGVDLHRRVRRQVAGSLMEDLRPDFHLAQCRTEGGHRDGGLPEGRQEDRPGDHPQAGLVSVWGSRRMAGQYNPT